MSFSQSFSFGDDTLDKLDVCGAENERATEQKTTTKTTHQHEISPHNRNPNRPPQQGTSSRMQPPNAPVDTRSPDPREMVTTKSILDVIDESPTDKKEVTLGRSIRERLKNASTSKKYHRKHLRRSKSDPLSKDELSMGSMSVDRTHLKSSMLLADDMGGLLDSSDEWMAQAMPANRSLKSKSKLCDKFGDDDMDSFLNNIDTQPPNHDNTKELIAISSSDEDVQVSAIERMLNGIDASRNATFNVAHSINGTLPKEESSFLDNLSADASSEMDQNICADSMEWEDSAFFNNLNGSLGDLSKANGVDEANGQAETNVDVLIDADCNVSVQHVDHVVDDELESCLLEVSVELSRLNDTHRLSQATSQLANNNTSQRPAIPIVKSQTLNTTRSEVNPSKATKTQLCLSDINNLSQWGCTPAIVREYLKRGIQSMFEWQVECLSKPEVKEEYQNLVYSAPTSAGKTFVSEILMFQTVLKRQRKALFILPFISVAREKMYYLQDLLRSSGIRAEGFFGGYTAPGGFDTVDIAICTIEKANAIVNRLLEQNKLDTLGTVVVDEVHLISDPNRGYILELLLAKILFCSRKLQQNIQIVTLSATLPNTELLRQWLNAQFYQTDFRPIELQEMIKIDKEIYDNSMNSLRAISSAEFAAVIENDQDNVAQLCIETITIGASVIVFCPSKDWCESLAMHIAESIYKMGKSQTGIGEQIRKTINMQAIGCVKSHLKQSPTGMDAVLEKTISYGVAFHHAGLTFDEREIIENSFSNGSLRVIVGTTCLSSGVNLPARRVIIRTPLFGGKMMNALTYKQMIGRAGRMGKDIKGESILICSNTNARIGQELIGAKLKPLESCLAIDNYTHLKRAILEIIASGVATTRHDLKAFVESTLLYADNHMEIQYFDDILNEFMRQTRSAKKVRKLSEDEVKELDFVGQCMHFLERYEFIRIQYDDVNQEVNYISTRLGYACLASSMPPGEGFLLFTELQKARQSFVLESELHAVYTVTPFSVCYQLNNINWLLYLDLWEKLSPAMQRVGELVGVKESFLVKAMRGINKLDHRTMQIHKRFYTALALQELIEETPLHEVAAKYKFNRGTLQSLQQTTSTFAGIVKSFCSALNWSMLALIVAQFKDRIFFGVHQDLIEIMKIPVLGGKQRMARILFDAGYQTLADLSTANALAIQKSLSDSLSFDVEERDGESNFDAAQRKKTRLLFVSGKEGLNICEAAKAIVDEARYYLQQEMGVRNIVWNTQITQSNEKEVNSNGIVPNTPMRIHRSQIATTPVAAATTTTTPLSSTSKRKLSEALNANYNSPKRNKNGVVPMDGTYSESSSSEISENDANDLNESTSIYNDDQDEFLQQFRYLFEPTQNRLQSSATLRIVDIIESVEKFNEFVGELRNVNECAIELAVCKRSQANPENFNRCIISTEYILFGMAFCIGRNFTVYFLNLQSDGSVSFNKRLELVQNILKRRHLTLQINQAKRQMKTLAKAMSDASKIQCSFQDPEIANWLLKPDEDGTFERMLSLYTPELLNLSCTISKGRSSASTTYTIRSSIKACITAHILSEQLNQLNQPENELLMKTFHEMEMPIQRSLLHMELFGMALKSSVLNDIQLSISDHIERLENELFRLHGKRFAVSSSRAVAQALRICRKNGTIAARCTRKDLLATKHPLAKLVLEHRSLTAILKNSLQPLCRKVVNERIYGNSISVTQTGRISMHEPNLQNVAKDFTSTFEFDGSVMNKFSCRSAFVVPSHRLLISADFCQLELRVLAHLSNDEALKKVFGTVNDVFVSIAAKWYKVTEIDVTDKMRNDAKQICYGIIYGMGVKSLAVAMNCNEDEAFRLYESFHNTYPGIRNYTQRVITGAREKGYVETIGGRKRFLPDINARENPRKQAKAERVAVNTTIQGSAADIAKYAILRMERNLIKYRTVLRNESASDHIDLVLHLHDELIYEVPLDKSNQVIKILKSSMENCAKLSVPLKVKIKKGKSWGTMSTIV